MLSQSALNKPILRRQHERRCENNEPLNRPRTITQTAHYFGQGRSSESYNACNERQPLPNRHIVQTLPKQNGTFNRYIFTTSGFVGTGVRSDIFFAKGSSCVLFIGLR